VFALYKLFAPPAEREAMAQRYRAGGFGYGQAKKALFEAFEATFSPLRRRREELAKDPGYVEGVLRDGAARARATAQATLAAARKAMGVE
jgi:tryptophanyl-tRNA synthetase